MVRTRLCRVITLAVAAVSCLALWTLSASAQPRQHAPASALLFPLFDSGPDATTLITVTNTNTSFEECNEHYRAGDVRLHYQYIDGEAFAEFDRYEFLTPGDTLTVRSDTHNPEGKIGYLLVTAERADAPHAYLVSDFDYLVGSAIVVRASDETAFRYVPYSFQSALESPDACTIVATDLDGDGAIDFDGNEYVTFPREVIVDSFFEQGARFDNELVLMTTAGNHESVETDFFLLNNQGELFRGALQFQKFWVGSVSDLTPVASELGGDPLEFARPSVETGWLMLRRRRIFDQSGRPVLDIQGNFAIPPILGVFAQRIEGTGMSMAHTLMYRGRLDGLELVGGNRDPQDNSGL